jgi:hypothetical protein
MTQFKISVSSVYAIRKGNDDEKETGRRDFGREPRPVAPAQSTLKIKVYIVSNETVPASHEVVETLCQKMNMIKTFRFADTEPPNSFWLIAFLELHPNRRIACTLLSMRVHHSKPL